MVVHISCLKIHNDFAVMTEVRLRMNPTFRIGQRKENYREKEQETETNHTWN